MIGRVYGASLDARIMKLFAEGLVARDIAKDLGVSRYFLQTRADVLGIRAELRARGQALAQAKRKRLRGPSRRRLANFDYVRRLTLTGRQDDLASRLLRGLRAHRPALDSACIDPDHIAACLHHRGLTLPEIQEIAGIPPRDAVAAIRALAGSLAA